MLPIYASFRPQLPTPPTVTTSSGGTTSIARDYYYFLQLQNRSGRNLQTAGVNVTVNPGEKLTWTVPSGTVESGEEVFWYVLSASSDSDPINAKVIAKIQAREADHLTVRSLPLSLELTSDEHFELSATVADTWSFPANPLNGMMRFVTTENRFYRYDAEALDVNGQIYSYGVPVLGVLATTGAWVITTEPFESYLDNVTSGGAVRGSDRALRDATDALEVPPKGTTTDSTPIRVWLLNGDVPDGQSPLPAGTRYNFVVKVNGTDYSSRFIDSIKATGKGRIEKATGALDTGVASYNELTVWNPDNSFLELKEDLNRGYALSYDLVLSFDNNTLLDIAPDGAQLTLDILQRNNNTSGSVNSAIASINGDGVLPQGDLLLVVPHKLLTGKASFLPSYLIQPSVEQPLTTPLVADTSDQIVSIDITLEGLPRVRANTGELTTNERIRAYVGTEPGIAVFSDPSNTINFAGASGESLEVTLIHPLNPSTLQGTIRSDYPDTLLRNNSKGSFNPPQFYLFLDLAGAKYQSPPQTINLTATQTITFTDLSGFSNISNFPTPDIEGLFKADIGIAKGTGGNFPSGNLTAYIAYYYPSPNTQITAIDHQRAGTVPTQTTPIAQAVSNGLLKANNLSDVDDLNTAKANLGIDTNETAIAALRNVLFITQLSVSNNTSAISANLAAINANTTAITNNSHTVYSVADIVARDALTGLKNNDLALVADTDGNGNGANYIYVLSTTSWLQFYDLAGGASGAVNNVYSVADISARDALTNLEENDIAKVADDGTGNPRDYVWDGTQWLAFVGSAASSGIEVYEVADIAARDALTGLSEGDIAKVADDGTGNPGCYVYSGTAWLSISDASGSPVDASDGTNTVSSVSEFQFTGATVTDLGNGQAAIAYTPTPGSFLFPNHQFYFPGVADTTDITTVTPTYGTSNFQDIKILTTANTPDNQIISNQLVIGEPNTGAVADVGTSAIALRVSWLVESGINLVFICRYDSNGNMIIVEVGENAISLSTVVADAVTSITPITAFTGSFTIGSTQDIQLYVTGGLYTVISNSTIVFEAVSAEFSDRTLFGVGRR